MDHQIELFNTTSEVPNQFDILFEPAGGRSLFLSRAWFETLEMCGLETGVQPRFYGLRDAAGKPMLLLPAATSQLSGKPPGRPRTLDSLSNYYSMVFAPLIRSGLSDIEVDAALLSLCRHLHAERPRWDVLHFRPLTDDDLLTKRWARALRRSGFFTFAYERSKNWFVNTRGFSPDDYLALRPSALRNTIKRRQRKAEEAGLLEFRVFGGDEVLPDGAFAEGVAAYESVYAKSWKQPEPNPAFMPAFARLCRDQGVLRLGVLYMDAQPAAAQFWICQNGNATIYKLAHDPAFDSLSIGTILTKKMMDWIIENDRPNEVDYGLGDEPYKQNWMTGHRTRKGLVSYRRGSLAGILGAARELMGRIRGYIRGPKRARQAGN